MKDNHNGSEWAVNGEYHEDGSPQQDNQAAIRAMLTYIEEELTDVDDVAAGLVRRALAQLNRKWSRNTS